MEVIKVMVGCITVKLEPLKMEEEIVDKNVK